MAEYIEKEAAMLTPVLPKEHRRYQTSNLDDVYAQGLADALDNFKNAPAADVAPVVHGRWEWFDEDVGTPVTGYEREWGWRCSHCGEELPDDYDDPDDSPKFRFCYNCGAKMDGGDSGAKSV